MLNAATTTVVLGASDSGNFLVRPSIGLMIWTLIAFGTTLFLLRKYAFPFIQEALDEKPIEIFGTAALAASSICFTETANDFSFGFAVDRAPH